MDKVDLNAPAFGVGAQIVGETVVEPTKVEEVKTEEVKTKEPSEEESKVPYSRFKKFHDRALEAEKEAAEWRSRAEAIKTEPVSTDDLPAHWLKLYGDSDASKEAWKIQKQANENLIEQARAEALEAVRNERGEEVQRTEENIEKLDENFEDLTSLVGRDLTDKEQSAILDIVDDYTPKDRNGNYAGELLPFEKAWEIYELKNQISNAPKNKARDQVASLSSNRTQGEPTITDADKNFNPMDWNAWRKRV